MRNVSGSSLGRGISYPDWGLLWFSSVLPGKYRDSTWIRLWPLPWKSFAVWNSSPFIFFSWGETESTWYCDHYWPIVPARDDRWWLWSNRWNANWQGKPKYSEKTYPSASSSTTNPTWPDPGSNPSRRGGKPEHGKFIPLLNGFIVSVLKVSLITVAIPFYLFLLHMT
jgi:hypothetical protein